MGHTYTSNLLHIVFSTKERKPYISDSEKLWAYLFGIAMNHGVPILAIGGIADHVHVLAAIPASVSVANVVTKLKANSSRWMRQSVKQFSWQEGYGAFSVSASQGEVVKRYIQRQKEHHAKRDFATEFVAMLKKSGIAYDPRYVLG